MKAFSSHETTSVGVCVEVTIWILQPLLIPHRKICIMLFLLLNLKYKGVNGCLQGRKQGSLCSARFMLTLSSLAPVLYQSMPGRWQVHNLWKNAARNNLSTKTAVCVLCIGAFTEIFYFAWTVSLFSVCNFKVQAVDIQPVALPLMHPKTRPQNRSNCVLLAHRKHQSLPPIRLHRLLDCIFNKRKV